MARVSRKTTIDGNTAKKCAESTPQNYLTGIYLRISSEHQEAKDDQTLYNQEQVIRNYISDKAEFQLYQVYCDNGCTGTNFKREAFEQMMMDIKAGKINCIIVKDLSRLGRNHLEVEQYLQVIFPFLKVRFISVNDNYDSSNQNVDITVSLKNIINAAYAKDISRKIYSAKQTLMEKGLFVGNIPPYGYDKAADDPHKLVVNRHSGRVVKEIFKLKSEGMKYAHIADRLNQMKEPAPMKFWYLKGQVHNPKYENVMWSIPTVSSILRSGMYLGNMIQGKKRRCLAEGKTEAKKQMKEDYIIVKNTHQAIIDQQTFETVQKICDEELQANRDKRWRNDNLINTEKILENLIYSMDGQKMYRTRNVYDNQKITYGYITAKSRDADGDYLTKYYIGEEKVLDTLKKVIDMHLNLLFSPDNIAKMIKTHGHSEEERKHKEKAINDLTKRIDRCREQGAAIYEKMTEGTMTFSEYEMQRAKYLKEKGDYDEELRKLQVESIAIKQHASQKEKFMDQAEKYAGEKEACNLTKELVQLLVKRVIIAGDKEIKIVLRYKDEFKFVKESIQMKGAR